MGSSCRCRLPGLLQASHHQHPLLPERLVKGLRPGPIQHCQIHSQESWAHLQHMFIFKDISGAFGFNLTLGTSLSSLRRKHCVRLYAKIHRTGRKPLLGLRLGLGYLTTPFQQHFCLLLGPFLLLVLTVGGIYIGGFQAPEHTWNQKSKISSDLGFFPTLGNICLNEFLNLPENSCTEYGRLTVN